MILANGKLYDTARQDAVLSGLETCFNRTLAERSLSPDMVIRAIDRLGQRLDQGDFDALLAQIEQAGRYLAQIRPLLSRAALQYKLQMELGTDAAYTTSPPGNLPAIGVRRAPLGVLFHIAAGNVDGLPAYSVVEGLLTGNINILKLPQADNGLSIEILRELIREEPALAAYIYVFDTPSADVDAMRRMAALSDGIVVWGGDEAVSAVRRLAPVGAKLIEWGHRLSFAYLSGAQDRARDWPALAKHIIQTRQLLCSSCQVIYLDTDSMEEIHAFCRAFLPVLEQAALGSSAGLGAAAEQTLRRYQARIERAISGQTEKNGRTVYDGRGCSLTACDDPKLELSDLFGNPLVKALPRSKLLPVLRRQKGRLQTAGLLCPEADRAGLTDLLVRAGVTRVLRAGEMSDSFCGEAHDGAYPLQQYTRIVNVR